MAKDFLKEMFINEAKPALERYSGTGEATKILNIITESVPGTPIPNDGTVVNGFYLNTELNGQQVHDIISSANLPYVPEYSAYAFMFDASTMNAYVIHQANGYYDCISRINFANMTDFVDWSVNGEWTDNVLMNTIDGYIELSNPVTTTNDFMGMPIVGIHNDKLSQLISLTPFTTEVERKYVGVLRGDYKCDELNVEENCSIDLLSSLTKSRVYHGKINVDVPEPWGTEYIYTSGIYDVARYAKVNVNTNPSGSTTIKSNGTYNVAPYAQANVTVPQPSGEIFIESNGTHDVEDYSSANVSVLIPESDKYTSLKNFFYKAGGHGDIFRGIDHDIEDWSTILKYADTEDLTDFSMMHWDCSSVTEFPLINTSKGTDFNRMYYGCSSAKSFPLIDTSKGTNFEWMYRDCTSATEFPLIDTSKGTDFYSMYYRCSSATEFPALNTSKGTAFHSMYENCTSATEFPALNTSNGTKFGSMYSNCSSAKSFPLIDTSKGTNFEWMYRDCTSATEFPLIDTSKGTDFYDMYRGCTSATSFPLIDTSNGTYFSNMYRGCTSATEIPALNVSKGLTFDNMYAGCSNLTSILMYGMKVDFTISSCPKLEAPALVTIISNCRNVKTFSSNTLTMGSTLFDKLTDVYVKLTGEELYEGITCNPCVICDSTDEGAMTVQEYATLKGWGLN